MRLYLLMAGWLLVVQNMAAQYISRSEPVPYNCPSTCAGGTIILKIPQVQNLPNGALLQALLSNANGSFASGTTALSSTRYSFNQGNTWINGAYTFSGNVNDLYFEITIPTSQPSGSNYTIRMISNNGYQSPDLFQCSGGDKITVSAGYTPLPPVSPTAQGTNQWIAHVYTWTPSTPQPLTTDQLTATQDFYNTQNYKGHFLKNSLSFDINYMMNGAVCPGAINVLHDGTSIPCSQGYSTNFSIRLLRKENFTPGLYRFEIGSDDGIRLSVDGGNTWLLNSFYEQTYAASVKNTDAQYPNGICLSGPTDLVLEYFQRPVDARLTFNSTLLSQAITPPTSQSICEGDSAVFSTTAIPGYTYQWQVSSNGGQTFTDVSNGNNYTGATTPALTILTADFSFNGYQYRCVITGLCGDPVTTASATLTVGQAAQIQNIPADTTICENQPVQFSATANGTAYQWQQNTGTGFANVTDGGIYSGATTTQLSINNAGTNLNASEYVLLATGCNGTISSDTFVLTVLPNASFLQSPASQNICDEDTVLFFVSISGFPGAVQWQKSTDNGTSYTDIPGATDTLLLLTPVSESEDGNLFRCVITTCSGELLSSAALLDICEKKYNLAIPQAFTPNGDGQNDFFLVLGDKAEVENWVINIYNRWGERVFASNDVNFTWDGTFRGKEQSVGTFVYYASATFSNGDKKDFQGNITLIR